MLESQIRTLRQSSSLETTRLKDELRSKADQLEQLRQQLVSKESWWKEQLKVSRAELELAKKEGAERASFLQASLCLALEHKPHALLNTVVPTGRIERADESAGGREFCRWA